MAQQGGRMTISKATSDSWFRVDTRLFENTDFLRLNSKNVLALLKLWSQAKQQNIHEFKSEEHLRETMGVHVKSVKALRDNNFLDGLVVCNFEYWQTKYSTKEGAIRMRKKRARDELKEELEVSKVSDNVSHVASHATSHVTENGSHVTSHVVTHKGSEERRVGKESRSRWS